MHRIHYRPLPAKKKYPYARTFLNKAKIKDVIFGILSGSQNFTAVDTPKLDEYDTIIYENT